VSWTSRLRELAVLRGRPTFQERAGLLFQECRFFSERPVDSSPARH